MRIKEVIIGVVLVTLAGSVPAWGSEAFYKVNKDLERVWLDKIGSQGLMPISADSYRLPPDFELGYGDTVVVNLWGKLEASFEIMIDKDGYLVIPPVGRVYILGLTLDEARRAVGEAINEKFTNVEFSLDVTNVKDILIEVLGNVENPGVYGISPGNRITEALAKAGGPNAYGSLSNIKLTRDGKEICVFNLYDYVIGGQVGKNMSLKQGDIVFVPLLKSVYAIKGDIRYPGIYDQSGDAASLSRAVELAGGMLPTTLTRKISVVRIDPETQQTEIVKEIVLSSPKAIAPKEDFSLENFDTVIIGTDFNYSPEIKELFRYVSVSGEVERPGQYVLSDGEKLSVILKSARLTPKAFIKGAVFIRPSLKDQESAIRDELIRAQERAILREEVRLAGMLLSDKDRQLRQMAINNRREALDLIAARMPEGRIIIDFDHVLKGELDIALKGGDEIFIPALPESVMVTGAVYRPQSVGFVPDKTMDYYLRFTGGMTDDADPKGVHVIKVDGRAESGSTGFGKILRGDIIIVPQKMD